MSTVYALDIRRKKRVRVDGVVHFAAREGFSIGGETPKPWRTRCGVGLSETEKLAYLGDAEGVVVTCIACTAAG